VRLPITYSSQKDKLDIGKILIIELIQKDVLQKPDGLEVLQVAGSIAGNYCNVTHCLVKLNRDKVRRFVDISALNMLMEEVGAKHSGSSLDRVYIVAHHYDSQACSKNVLSSIMQYIKNNIESEVILVSCNSANYSKKEGQIHKYRLDSDEERKPEPVLFTSNLGVMPTRGVFREITELLKNANFRGNIIAFNSLVFSDQHKVRDINSRALKRKESESLKSEEFEKAKKQIKNVILIGTNCKLLFSSRDNFYGKLNRKINGIRDIEQAGRESRQLFQNSVEPMIISFRCSDPIPLPSNVAEIDSPAV
jgi:hypothetical protein